MSNIGMMDGAFFVGRKEIMDWVNSTLELNLSKVEDTASGAVACQILDVMYPGVVPMHKIDWAAKKDFEYVANYKILQSCFNKLNIERRVDVDRLISGRYMDNLEFLQWYKRFFEMKVTDKGDYDAYTQRCKGKGGKEFGGGRLKLKPAAVIKTPNPSVSSSNTNSNTPAVVSKVTKGPAMNSNAPVNNSRQIVNQENAVPSNKIVDVPIQKNSMQPEKVVEITANEESQKANNELQVEMEGLEKERDFYFEKLRDIELYLQDLEDNGNGNDVTAHIFKILYATKDGFEASEVVNDLLLHDTAEVEF